MALACGSRIFSALARYLPVVMGRKSGLPEIAFPSRRLADRVTKMIHALAGPAQGAERRIGRFVKTGEMFT